jgi:hypothetical protein
MVTALEHKPQSQLVLNSISRSRTLLLLLVQGEQRYAGHFNDLESNSRNITDGMSFTTESGDENFIVFL